MLDCPFDEKIVKLFEIIFEEISAEKSFVYFKWLTSSHSPLSMKFLKKQSF